MVANIDAAWPVVAKSEGRVHELFERHHARLFALALRMVREREDAKDLVQETYLRAARYEAKVPGGASAAEAWLVRVLINLVRDQSRRRKVRRGVQTLVTDNRLAQRKEPSKQNMESALVARHSVARALRELPVKRRAVVVMAYLEERTTAEIAELMGMQSVTVRWHLSLARRTLAAFLAAEKERQS